jgi:hypothetical protein
MSWVRVSWARPSWWQRRSRFSCSRVCSLFRPEWAAATARRLLCSNRPAPPHPRPRPATPQIRLHRATPQRRSRQAPPLRPGVRPCRLLVASRLRAPRRARKFLCVRHRTRVVRSNCPRLRRLLRAIRLPRPPRLRQQLARRDARKVSLRCVRGPERPSCHVVAQRRSRPVEPPHPRTFGNVTRTDRHQICGH